MTMDTNTTTTTDTSTRKSEPIAAAVTRVLLASDVPLSVAEVVQRTGSSDVPVRMTLYALAFAGVLIVSPRASSSRGPKGAQFQVAPAAKAELENKVASAA